MICKLKPILLFIAILIGVIVNGQNHYNFKASHFDYSSKDTLVKFNFDIKHFKDNDVFNVKLSAVDKNQKSYNVNSLFEHKDLKGGKNTIFWNPLLDGYKLDGDYQINLELRKSSKIKIPYSKHIVKSLLFPGWGDMKLRNANKFFLFGIGTIAYGSLFYSLDYNSRANKNYNAYINSYNVEESDNFFLNAKKDANISRILAGITAVTWSADIIFLAKRIKKVKNDGTVSKFYNKMQNRVNSTKYKNYKYLNTKPKEEKYLDSAIVEYKNSNYLKSENLLKIAQTYPSKDTLVLQDIEKYASIVKDELDFIAYNKLGNEKLKKLQLIDAKKDFLKAQKIKPNSRGVVNKIDSIKNYYAYLKKGNKYYKIKDYDNAQLSYENANKIYKTDSSKFKVLISKADNYYTQKFYLRSRTEYEKALRLYSNNLVIKQKIKELNIIINKINSDNKEFAKYVKDGDDFSADDDFNNAIVYYNKALKLKPKNTELNNKINKINDYKGLIKIGDNFFNKNKFKSAIRSYKKAQILFDTYDVKRKIDKTKGEMQWDILVGEGDEFVRTKKYEEAIEKYEEAKRIRSTPYLLTKIKKANQGICDDIVKVANNLKASKKWKEALEKYEEVNRLCPSPNIDYQIKIAKQKLKNQKLGEKIVNKKWYEIYNQNGLKVELLFEIKKGLCTSPYAVIYIEYRYTGKVSNTYNNKYLNWSVEYERCDNSKWKFNHAVQVSGDLFKQPTTQNTNYLGSNFIKSKKIKVMNELIKAGNDNIYFDVKSIKELSSKYIRDVRK